MLYCLVEMIHLRTFATVTFTFTLAACGPTVQPPNPAPEPQAFVDDTDPVRARVTTAKQASAPMVVDWKPEHRADLEVRTKRGPALVRFDEKTFELMPDCDAPGAYGYVGVTPKQEMVSFQSRAELHTNLPFSAVSLEAKLARSGALNVDLRMVGQRVLDRPTVSRSDLKGRCQGVTHFVQTLTVGAFRLSSSTAAEAKAGAKILTASAGAESSGTREMLQVDGDFGACDGADPTGSDAPSRCAAVLRIRIVPVDASAEVAAKDPSCGEGMQWDGRACVTQVRLEREAKQAAPASDTTPATQTYGGFECEVSNARQCLDQCKLGNFPSCANLGLHLENGSEMAPKDPEKAEAFYRLACDKGVAKGCMFLGNFYDVRQNYAESAKYGAKACLAGEQAACTNVAVNAFYGRGMQEDRPMAYRLWERACKLQDWMACSNAGAVIFNGIGVPKNQPVARQLFERACNATGHAGCNNLGITYELGMGGPQDITKAVEHYLQGCNAKDSFGCMLAGLVAEEKLSSADRFGKALSLYEKGCGLPGSGGCLSVDEMQSTFGGRWNNEGLIRRSCDGATTTALSCYNAAIIHERGSAGSRDMAKAKANLDAACKGGLQRACRAPSTIGSQFNTKQDAAVPGMETPEKAARHLFDIAKAGDWVRLAQDAMMSHSLLIDLSKALKPNTDPEKQWQSYNGDLRKGVERIQKEAAGFVAIAGVERKDIEGFEVFNVKVKYKKKDGKEKTDTFLLVKLRGRLYAVDMD